MDIMQRYVQYHLLPIGGHKWSMNEVDTSCKESYDIGIEPTCYEDDSESDDD